MAEIDRLRQRTEELLREYQTDITNPMRGWGEMDCLVELRILEEMEESMVSGELIMGVAVKIVCRDGAYIATIKTPKHIFRASCMVSEEMALRYAIEKWEDAICKAKRPL